MCSFPAMNLTNFLLLILNGLHQVNSRLVYNYNNATLERVLPLIDRSFIERIFPDYPCLFLNARPESYLHGVLFDQLYKQLSDIALLNTNIVHSTSVCRGMIIISTSMNVAVDFIMQNKPFHKNMRIYIILIKYWDQYLFFQEHWSRELLDMEILVLTVFPRQIKVHRLFSHSSEFRMVGVRKKTNYFPSFNTLPKPSIMNYKGRQIVVSTFKCHLFNSLRALTNFSSASSVAFKSPTDPYGIEERIFLEIASRMNLTWKLRIPTVKRLYGTNFVNKSLSGGLMTDLWKGDADIGFCALWYDQVKIKSFDMSVFWSAVCPKFLFPKPTKLQTNWQSLFEPFNWEIWTLLFSCILLQTYVLMWTSTHALRLKIISTRYYLHPMNSFLEVIRILFMAGCMSTKKMPRLGPLRHLISWWFVFSLVVATIYSTSYYSHLTSPEYTPKIEGIQELQEQNVRWGSPFPPPHSWIFHDTNPVHQEYGKLYEMESSVKQRIKRLEKGNYAVYCTNLNNLFFMDVDQISSTLLTQLRSFRGCLSQFFVSFGLRLGTSYLEQVNTIILRLLQTGIIDYWLIRVVLLHYHRNPFSQVYEYKPQNNKSMHEPLTLSSLQGAFYLYLVGTAVAGGVFLLELRQKSRLLSREKIAALPRLVVTKTRCPRQQRSRRVQNITQSLQNVLH